MESCQEDLAIRTVKVASLSLLPNVAPSLSLASTSCSCIKRRIVLVIQKKGETKKKKGLKGAR